MPNIDAKLDYIDIPPGVTPVTDDTDFASVNYSLTSGIRFRNGRPEKKGGYQQFSFQSGQSILGTPRSEFATEINGKFYTLIGSEKRLYALIGSSLTNITPLLTSSTAAANGLSTLYGTLGSDPISVTIGSNVVTVTDSSASRLQVNDTVTLSGATTTGGITNTMINAAQVVRSVDTANGKWTFRASGNASSTATGGGASVVRKTGLLRCTVVNTLVEGDRVKIASAADTGGILAAAINLEFIVRNVTSGHFDFMTASTATSSVSAAGGGSTVFYPPIANGLSNESYGVGFGMGKFGVGLFGVSKTSTTAHLYPRIWYFDRFGDYIMMTPGNGGKLYEWDGNISAAPVVTTNAPTAINYMYVSDNTVVVFGKSGVENAITASDQGNRTVWSGTAQNQFFDSVVSGATRFISAIKLDGVNLIFTENQCYTMRQIGLPNVWEVKKLSDVGMISSMAGLEVNGIAYWQGRSNFYTWSGGSVQIQPSNVYPVSSILRYTFDNLNYGQKSKCFCWFNKRYQEIRFHYPSAGSNEPDRISVVNLLDNSWWPDEEARTCAERPTTVLSNPRLLDANGVMWTHESGADNGTNSLPFSITTNIRTLGKNEALLSAFIPDSIQTGGDINVTVNAFQWPNDTVMRTTETYDVSIGSGRVPFGQQGRFWTYTIEGDVLGQTWRMGHWAEEKQLAGDGA